VFLSVCFYEEIGRGTEVVFKIKIKIWGGGI